MSAPKPTQSAGQTAHSEVGLVAASLSAAVVALSLSAWGAVAIWGGPDLDTVPALGDGTHMIGSADAPHATWIAPGGPRCAWAAYGAIVGDGQPEARGAGAGRQVANLEGDQQVLRTQGCGTWTLATYTPTELIQR